MQSFFHIDGKTKIKKWIKKEIRMHYVNNIRISFFAVRDTRFYLVKSKCFVAFLLATVYRKEILNLFAIVVFAKYILNSFVWTQNIA